MLLRYNIVDLFEYATPERHLIGGATDRFPLTLKQTSATGGRIFHLR